MKTTKQFKSQQLWYRLSLTPDVMAMATEEEKAHADIQIKRRKEARRKLMAFRAQRSINSNTLYNADFWTAHTEHDQADNSIRGLRSILRLRYARSIQPGLYQSKGKTTYGKQKVGMYGKGRGHYIKKDGLLMWIERDEFGDNWFLDLDENKIIVCIKGAAIQNIVPVPPEKEKQK